jgi:hypothetical protein
LREPDIAGGPVLPLGFFFGFFIFFFFLRLFFIGSAPATFQADSHTLEKIMGGCRGLQRWRWGIGVRNSFLFSFFTSSREGKDEEKRKTKKKSQPGQKWVFGLIQKPTAKMKEGRDGCGKRRKDK